MAQKFVDRVRRLVSRKTMETGSMLPADERTYAIGDIHGCADLLTQLLEMICADARIRGPAHNRIVYLGDYIDRGPDSRKVIELARTSSPEEFATVYLRGNHEALMLDFLVAPHENSAWIHNGGDATLQSFGVAAPSEFAHEEKLAEAARALSEALLPQELEFLRALQPSFRLGDYFFAHAGIDPQLPLDEQSTQDLIWIRRPFLESKADFGAVVVHGHSVRRDVEIRPNRIGIDTGAYATGKLTALGLQGRERWLLQTHSSA